MDTLSLMSMGDSILQSFSQYRVRGLYRILKLEVKCTLLFFVKKYYSNADQQECKASAQIDMVLMKYMKVVAQDNVVKVFSVLLKTVISCDLLFCNLLSI